MLDSGWITILKPKVGCVLEWEARRGSAGKPHKHLGFFIGDNRAISNILDVDVPTIHHWTYGEKKDGKPERIITALYWHPLLSQ